ncbi:MAG: hypothetical protein U9O41_07675 [Candidatus Aerophobetes bacterium]|nr:hypothetical protein [Candidatus Aerophobetes bacterium]
MNLSYLSSAKYKFILQAEEKPTLHLTESVRIKGERFLNPFLEVKKYKKEENGYN